MLELAWPASDPDRNIVGANTTLEGLASPATPRVPTDIGDRRIDAVLAETFL